MKRACSFILVFALSLAVPAYSSSHAGMDPFDMSVEGEDWTPDLFRIQTESNLICSEDSPLLVAEQKEAEQKEPDDHVFQQAFVKLLSRRTDLQEGIKSQFRPETISLSITQWGHWTAKLLLKEYNMPWLYPRNLALKNWFIWPNITLIKKNQVSLIFRLVPSFSERSIISRKSDIDLTEG